MNTVPSPIKQSPLSFKIILLGDSNIGKTSFIQQFTQNQFSKETKPTISVDFISKTYKVDQFTVKLNIFDTAGQERYRSLTKAYIKGTDAVLFMYSMQRYSQFDQVRKVFRVLRIGLNITKVNHKIEINQEFQQALRKILPIRKIKIRLTRIQSKNFCNQIILCLNSKLPQSQMSTSILSLNNYPETLSTIASNVEEMIILLINHNGQIYFLRKSNRKQIIIAVDNLLQKYHLYICGEKSWLLQDKQNTSVQKKCNRC